jgi:microcystin-dependent protein
LLKNGRRCRACLVKLSLWDAESTGNKLGETAPQTVTLDNGLFTVPAIDFGFDAQDRWLEVAVSCADPDYTTLGPRSLVGSTGGVPPGTVVAFAGRIVDVPAGWLLCNGAAIPRGGLYSRLFAAIGAAHGSGDGVSTFNLPDYRGRFLRGVNNSTGRDPDVASRYASAPGGFTGDSIGSLQDDSIGPHTHALSLEGTAGSNANSAVSSETGSGAAIDAPVRSSGTNIRAETRPKNVYVNWIIKY